MLSDRTGPPPPDNPHAGGGIPKVVPPLPRENPRARNLPWRTALDWLRAGWSDTWTNPLPSLVYGLGVFALSAFVIWFLFELELDYILFPALAGFMILGPLIASGLYEKSRRISDARPRNLARLPRRAQTDVGREGQRKDVHPAGVMHGRGVGRASVRLSVSRKGRPTRTDRPPSP